jgi:undecaprenyl-phosphate 4-deoxy-4-formamido-L-arabinose transferase
MFVSVIVPCYRSGPMLPALVERLAKSMPAITDGYEVLLVVDGSPDDTWDVARELALTHDSVRAMRLARNYGQHNALVAGVRAARYDVIVTMDDDLQHPPEEVHKLLDALTDDVDLVYGVAEEEEHSFARSLASRAVKAGMARSIGVDSAKHLSAFRAFRSFMASGFDQIHGPHASVDVTLSWTTNRVAATTVHMDQRREGRSGYTFKKLMGHTINMVTGYSTKPLRLVTYMGLAVGLVGLALLGRTLWLYFSGSTTIAGFTTIASMVSLFSSAQLIGIGVVGEYLGRLHSQNMGRPTYVVRERVDEKPTIGATAADTSGPPPLHAESHPRPSQRTVAAG